MIAVWAVNLHLIYKSVGDYSQNNQISRVILVTTPRAKNSYLHNQEGFFLIDLQADYFNYPPLEDAIADIQNELVNKGNSQFNSDQILKLQLSWNFVPELLALLWFEFYNIDCLYSIILIIIWSIQSSFYFFKNFKKVVFITYM